LRGIRGEPIGHAHSNPFVDTREYEVKFTDGTTEKNTVNVIADSMYAQIDNEGNMFQLLSEMVDHKKLEWRLTSRTVWLLWRVEM
jgi:hypothetical protein